MESAQRTKDERAALLSRLGALRHEQRELEARLGVESRPELPTTASPAAAAYELVEQHCTDLISVHASNGDYLFVSRNLERFSGWSEDEVLGRNAYDFFHPEDIERIAADHAAHSDGDDGEVQYRLRCADGSYRWVETRSRAHRSARGVEQIVCVTRNIEALKQLELERARELELVREGLLRAERFASVGMMAATTAHELGNIAGAYMMLVHLLPRELRAHGTLSAETQQRLEQVGNHIQEYARSLRDLTMPGRDEHARLDLARLASECAELLTRARLGRGVAIEVSVPDAPVDVEGHRIQIEQLVLNLLLNALDASQQPGSRPVQLQVRVTPDGRAAELAVSDGGCGIAAMDLERIFEPHFTTKGPDRGTGLGLTVVKQIVQLHNATMDVRSELGQGTELRVRFPLAEADNAPRAPEPSLEPGT